MCLNGSSGLRTTASGGEGPLKRFRQGSRYGQARAWQPRKGKALALGQNKMGCPTLIRPQFGPLASCTPQQDYSGPCASFKMQLFAKREPSRDGIHPKSFQPKTPAYDLNTLFPGPPSGPALPHPQVSPSAKLPARTPLKMPATTPSHYKSHLGDKSYCPYAGRTLLSPC